eukprot:m.176941 g.176941  ORF g.176941 m.176941 type:complete len:191 (+) comp24469_c0_seq4:94-666(+)
MAAAESGKLIFCHACRVTSEVGTDILNCPRCGGDFIEETGAAGAPVAVDGGGAIAAASLHHPLMLLVSRLVLLRQQLVGPQAGMADHDGLGELMAQLQRVGAEAGQLALDGAPVANPGDYVDDGRLDELLQTLFAEEGSNLTPALAAVIDDLQECITTMSESSVAGTPAFSFPSNPPLYLVHAWCPPTGR